ncbi:MAG: sulfatase-like hydrolase/transferase [Planctomycetes bacterium]|nr:sulfatase-like hydrolase/transferase [Planctomycetota bacterium]
MRLRHPLEPCRRLLVVVVCLATAPHGLPAADRVPSPRSESRPLDRNLVLVTFDDLRYDTPGFNGGPARTPNMDRLAAAATVFRSAMTTVGLCSPARATLFTGRYGHQTGLDDNCLTWHSRLIGLDASETTLIEWSHRAGYFVGYFGKWHLGPAGPYARGVDCPVVKAQPKRPWRPFRKPRKFQTIRRYYEPGRTFKEKPEYYGTRPGRFEDTAEFKYSQQAIRFLEQVSQQKRPFVLFLNYNAPHPPYVVPAPFNTIYSADRVSLPKNFLHRSDDKPRYQNDVLWYWHDVGHLTEQDWRRMRAHYYGFVTLADQAVGLVLRRLDELGLSDRTMVILVGDQGSMLGEHGLYDKGPYCYEELMRIPLVIRVPGERPGVVGRHVSIVDINQTVVDWLGLKPDPAPRFSRSLLPLVRCEPDAWSEEPDVAFYRHEWYNGSWYGIRAVRTPQWKYCWNPVGIDELYDLRHDPGEMINRINDSAAAPPRRRLQCLLLSHMKETGDPAARRFAEEAGLAKPIQRQADPARSSRQPAPLEWPLSGHAVEGTRVAQQ